MSKRLDSITIILVVLAIIGETLEDIWGGTYLSWWLATNVVWIFFIRFSLMLWTDVERIFPPLKRYTPLYLKRIIHWVYGVEKVPKPFVIQICISMVLFTFSTVFYLMLWLMAEARYGSMYVLSCIIIAIVLFIYVYYAVYFVIFKERFVRLNRYNIRYAFFFTYGLTCKWPLSKNLGRCEVIDLQEKQRTVTVRLIDKGNVIENVYFRNGVNHKNKNQYKLYEICQVKYISL